MPQVAMTIAKQAAAKAIANAAEKRVAGAILGDKGSKLADKVRGYKLGEGPRTGLAGFADRYINYEEGDEGRRRPSLPSMQSPSMPQPQDQQDSTPVPQATGPAPIKPAAFTPKSFLEYWKEMENAN